MALCATNSAPPAFAKSPQIYVIGENGFVGVNSDGQVHYVLTNGGFRFYDVPSYGYCGYHHRSHKCRYVAPHHKHDKKYHKKHKKERKKYYKKLKKEQKKYYRKHRHHDDDDD